MLTGRPPFADGTVLQKLLSHSSQPPPDPRTWRPDLPEGLLPLLDRMLAKDPSDRYRKPSELIGDLLLLANRLGVPTAVRTKPHWVPAPSGPTQTLTRHLPWFVPGCLMLALLLLDPDWLSGKAAPTTAPRFEIPAIQVPATEPTPSGDARFADGQLPVIPSGTWPGIRAESDLADREFAPVRSAGGPDENPSRDDAVPAATLEGDALATSNTPHRRDARHPDQGFDFYLVIGGGKLGELPVSASHRHVRSGGCDVPKPRLGCWRPRDCAATRVGRSRH